MSRGNIYLFIVVALGLIGGLGGYVIYASNAISYASDKPEACINCHIMGPQYASWKHSSHARVTTCNSCHVPQDNIFAKYAFKAKDGLYHSAMFTLGLEPEVIRARHESSAVIQKNCQQCHAAIVEGRGPHPIGEGRTCWSCHREVPHGRARSLSNTPNAQVPYLEPVFATFSQTPKNQDQKKTAEPQGAKDGSQKGH